MMECFGKVQGVSESYYGYIFAWKCQNIVFNDVKDSKKFEKEWKKRIHFFLNELKLFKGGDESMENIVLKDISNLMRSKFLKTFYDEVVGFFLENYKSLNYSKNSISNLTEILSCALFFFNTTTKKHAQRGLEMLKMIAFYFKFVDSIKDDSSKERMEFFVLSIYLCLIKFIAENFTKNKLIEFKESVYLLDNLIHRIKNFHQVVDLSMKVTSHSIIYQIKFNDLTFCFSDSGKINFFLQTITWILKGNQTLSFSKTIRQWAFGNLLSIMKYLNYKNLGIIISSNPQFPHPIEAALYTLFEESFGEVKGADNFFLQTLFFIVLKIKYLYYFRKDLIKTKINTFPLKMESSNFKYLAKSFEKNEKVMETIFCFFKKHFQMSKDIFITLEENSNIEPNWSFKKKLSFLSHSGKFMFKDIKILRGIKLLFRKENYNTKLLQNFKYYDITICCLK